MSDWIQTTGVSLSELADVLVRSGAGRAVMHTLSPPEAAALRALLGSSSYARAAEDPPAGLRPQLGHESTDEDSFQRFVRGFDSDQDLEPQLERFARAYEQAPGAVLEASAVPPVLPSDPIPALNRFIEIVTGFIPAQWFRTACNARLFDHLANGPRTSTELAGTLGIQPEACRSFLRALAELGVVEQHEDHWKNSELGNWLTSSSDVPLHTLGTWVEIFYPMWPFLREAMTEGTPRYEQAFHTSAAKTWEALFADADRLRLFCRFMNAYSIPIGRQIADRVAFGHVHRILDVAGGAGGLSAQLALRYPHLTGMVMDLPPVCAMAREYLASVSLSDRFTAVPGDLFEGPYPEGADAIVLSWILHDWSDEKCRRILAHCREALPPNGTLFVSEIVLPDDGTLRPFGNLMNMHMMVACDPGAKERTASEYGRLLNDSGFQNVEITRMSGPRDLIVARRP